MFISAENYSLAEIVPEHPAIKVDSLVEKGTGSLMEDVLLAGDNIFGVFDGSTSLDGWTAEDGTTGGRKAAQIASEAFAENNGSLASLAALANKRIRRGLAAEGIDMSERYRLWSTSFAVIRLSQDTFSWCQTGDSLILLVGKDGSVRTLGSEADHDTMTLQQWQLADNPAGLTIHELLREQIIEVREGMNRQYGVLNGEPAAMDFLLHGKESLQGIESILLFTDGLYLPKADPAAESNWCGFAELYKQGGLQEIHSHVRNLQRIDGDCKLFPRFKKHDDIAAVALDLQPIL